MEEAKKLDCGGLTDLSRCVARPKSPIPPIAATSAKKPDREATHSRQKEVAHAQPQKRQRGATHARALIAHMYIYAGATHET